MAFVGTIVGTSPPMVAYVQPAGNGGSIPITRLLPLRTACYALQAVPEGIELAEVKEYLAGLPHVTAVHELHIWPMSPTDGAYCASRSRC